MPRALVLSVVSALWALFACAAVSPEEQTLLRFFVAARTLDTVVIGKYATVGFDPRSDGIVQSFNVLEIREENEHRRSVTFDAVVLDPNGTLSRRMMVATFGKAADRWLITALRRIPASQISREASSGPRN